jgi:hypothetical protein
MFSNKFYDWSQRIFWALCQLLLGPSVRSPQPLRQLSSALDRQLLLGPASSASPRPCVISFSLALFRQLLLGPASASHEGNTMSENMLLYSFYLDLITILGIIRCYHIRYHT